MLFVLRILLKINTRSSVVNDKDSLIYCYEKLHDYFQNTVVITLEDKGSFTKLNDYEIIPSVKVQAVDSTGAGDIFHGAFTYFIGNGYSLKNAIHYASITSAISGDKSRG